MLEIKQKSFPELKLLKILRTDLDVEIFMSNIEETPVHKQKLKKLKLVAALQEWRKQQTADSDAFFAYEHELPDHQKNDGYGCYKLFRYIAIRDSSRKIHLLRNFIELFYY